MSTKDFDFDPRAGRYYRGLNPLLRGAIKRFDLDAYRRLHTTYRRGWKKRK